MLHIISKSPWKSDINSILRVLYKGDDILLIQDGVFAGLDGANFVEKFTKYCTNISVLSDDIIARGLIKKISSKIKIVSYIDFVNLTIKQTSYINW